MKLSQLHEAIKERGETETGEWVLTDSNLVLTHFDLDDETPFVMTPQMAKQAIEYRSTNKTYEVEDYDKGQYAILTHATVPNPFSGGRMYVDVEYHVPKQAVKKLAGLN